VEAVSRELEEEGTTTSRLAIRTSFAQGNLLEQGLVQAKRRLIKRVKPSVQNSLTLHHKALNHE
jgi:hypothetical protein